MPTGYTAAIADGIDFKTFVMQCARAFGATITMRDEPLDAEIPDEFQPSDYHVKVLKDAKDKLAQLTAMSPESAEHAAHQDYVDRLKDHRRYLREKQELREKYNAMLAQAKAWVPPSADHAQLKTFMIEQITGSIDFDCSVHLSPPERLSGAQWLENQINQATRDIAYHTKHDDEERERAQSRSQWVRQLRESLR